jgi:hypothetical protein
MSVPARLAAFAAVLALAVGGAALAGAAIDPTDATDTPPAPRASDSRHGDATGAPHGGDAMGARPEAGHEEASAPGGDGHAAEDVATAAAGLAVSDAGYTLQVDRDRFPAGRGATFSFRIVDDRGRVLRDEYEVEAAREMHLIVVRADTATYQHLHPRKGTDGTWSLRLELPEPGTYRAYADFMVDGEQRTLTTTLHARGVFRPQPLPAPAATDRAGGFEVELDAAGLRAGREGTLTFAVTRDGRPVEDLEDYLGAKGHLVALREGDLAYLHVHPTGGGADGHEDGTEGSGSNAGEVGFAATFPTAGRYRLFLQFRVGGEVRSVAYTLEVPR